MSGRPRWAGLLQRGADGAGPQEPPARRPAQALSPRRRRRRSRRAWRSPLLAGSASRGPAPPRVSPHSRRRALRSHWRSGFAKAPPPPGPDASTLVAGAGGGKPPGSGAALGRGRTARWGRLDIREASVRASAAPGGGQGRIRRWASPAVLFPRTPVDLVGGSFPELLTLAPWRLLRRPRPLRRTGAGEAAAAETTG